MAKPEEDQDLEEVAWQFITSIAAKNNIKLV